MAGLIQATDGNFYGTTHQGGTGLVPVVQGGTVFQITPSGRLTTLYSFCSQTDCTDGQEPEANLVQDTNGDLYGTALYGGLLGSETEYTGEGTVFHLAMGLPPFVKLLSSSGEAGTIVYILGTNLTGAISVTFGGTKALYEVVSSSLIAAKVPNRAHSGTVQVVTPGGTLLSNTAFRVTE